MNDSTTAAARTLSALGLILEMRERARGYWRKRWSKRPVPGQTFRLYDPEPGRVFVYASRPHDPFIRHPRTGTIMRVTTYARVESPRKALTAVKKARGLVKRAERRERRAAR